MMKRNRTRAKAKPLLAPKFPVDLKEERVEGTDGRRIFVDSVVRCNAYPHPVDGIEISTRIGVVLEAYRQQEDGPVLLLVRMDRDTACGGTAVLRADRCRGSKARVRGQDAADWHGHGSSSKPAAPKEGS